MIVFSSEGDEATSMKKEKTFSAELAAVGNDTTVVQTPELPHDEKIMGRIEPQPPRGIKYMLGDESWLPVDRRTPIRLECEEWGHIGPMVLDPSIPENAAGFRVRSTTIHAPEGAKGFTEVDGVYYWTNLSVWDRMAQEAGRSEGEPEAK